MIACTPSPVNEKSNDQNENEQQPVDSSDNVNPQPEPEPEPVPDPFWDVIEIDTDGLVKTEFTEDKTNIPNPERGFYSPYGFSRATSSISKSQLEADRLQGRTVALYEFWLQDYMDKDIDDAYLENITKAFSVMREGGNKCAVRFGYTQRQNANPTDAPRSIVMRHIEQIAPIIKANSDVILCLQAGFIGAWGEWYYTTNFKFGPSKYEDYEDRREVVNALLDALPSNRQIEVRCPHYKIGLLGIEKTDTLTHETAYKDTPKARIGGHNDCFVATDNDQGTFQGKAMRTFWEGDTQYTIMGGETCATSNWSGCSNSLKQLGLQHWTYLNIGYHGGVLRGWRDEGCMPEIELRLGYRLVMHESYISDNITAGSNVRTVFKLSNDGWAAPINPRALEVIIVNKDSGEKTVIDVPASEVNPRFWLAGKKPQFEVDFTAPAAGSYTLYLNLPDPETTLHNDPRYSIRFANQNTWEAETGYNKITEFVVE